MPTMSTNNNNCYRVQRQQAFCAIITEESELVLEHILGSAPDYDGAKEKFSPTGRVFNEIASLVSQDGKHPLVTLSPSALNTVVPSYDITVTHTSLRENPKPLVGFNYRLETLLEDLSSNVRRACEPVIESLNEEVARLKRIAKRREVRSTAQEIIGRFTELGKTAIK